MFLGFASYFATMFGGFGERARPLFALIAHWVAARGTVGHADDAGDEAARPASIGDPLRSTDPVPVPLPEEHPPS
jgi:hypothetical protein